MQDHGGNTAPSAFSLPPLASDAASDGARDALPEPGTSGTSAAVLFALLAETFAAVAAAAARTPLDGVTLLTGVTLFTGVAILAGVAILTDRSRFLCTASPL